MRNDIVWAKRNGMPESVTDRFSKKHEYFFFMAKQEKYYFNLDAIRGKQSEVSIKRYQYDFTGQEGGLSNNFKGVRLRDKSKEGYANAFLSPIGKGARPETNINGKNPGSVSDFWGHKQTFEEYMKVCEEYYYTPDDFLDIPTQPSSTQHYAAYNTKLISKPILAGSPKGGIILDPFCGTGTTGILALDLRRRFIGIEGKEEYCKIANKNISLIKRQASIDFDDLIVK
jgi:site-specific DNA-methyltransferase (cytosine-N4-specific)